MASMFDSSDQSRPGSFLYGMSPMVLLPADYLGARRLLLPLEKVLAGAEVHGFRTTLAEMHYVLVPDPEATPDVDPGFDAEHVADLERLLVAVPQVGLLVHFESEAVPRPVQECVPVAGLLDHRPRRPVYFPAREPRLQNGEGGVVRPADDPVGLFHHFFEVSREVYAGD